MHTCTHSHHSQAWDLEFLESSVEQANLAACKFWDLLKEMRPLMGPCNMLNWDKTYMFLFEVTNSRVYQDFTDEKMIDWCYLVAPGLAVLCCFDGETQTLEALDKFKDHCIKYNKKWGKTKASQGAYFAERMVLSKEHLKKPEIVARVGPKTNRVFWDRNSERGTHALLEESKAFAPMNNLEIVVTLSNWHFMANKEFTKKHLDESITPYLNQQCKDKGIIGDLEFTWAPTPQVNTWKLVTNNFSATQHICTAIIDLQVRQQDQVASMNFKSTFHKLGGQDLKSYFGTFALKDVQDEFGTSSESQGAAADMWQAQGQVSGQATQSHMAASSSSGLGAAMPAQPQVTSGGNVAQQADLAASTATMESWNVPNEETY